MYERILKLDSKLNAYPWLEKRGFSTSHIDSSITDLAWSPDGTRLASAHMDFAARIWNIQTLATEPQHYLIHGKFVASIVWSPDSRIVASGDTQADPVRIWNSQTAEQIEELYEHHSWPLSLDWHPSGKFLISSGMDERVLLWRVQDWTVVREIYTHIDADPNNPSIHHLIPTVRYSPDGQTVAFALTSGHIWLWKNEKLQQLPISQAKKSLGQIFTWCPIDSDRLAVSHENGDVSFWSVRNQTSLGYLPNTGQISQSSRHHCIAWSPNGLEIVQTGKDHRVNLWYQGNKQDPLIGHDDDVNIAKWSPDGKYLATGAADGTICIWRHQ